MTKNSQVLCQFADKYSVISPSQTTQTSQVSAVTQNSANNQLNLQTVTPASIKNWLAGQILKGVVIEQLSGTSLLLNIGNTKLTAKTDLNLPPGSVLQLRVTRTGDQPLLQIIDATKSNRNAEASLNALRQAIPKQLPLSNLFSNLKITNTSGERLPQIIQQAIQSLHAGMASRMDLVNPESVKKALTESGNFLESNLKNSLSHVLNSNSASDSIDGDLKAKLLRLATVLSNENTTALNKNQKQTPVSNNLLNMLSDNKILPEMQRHVESALARIQLNQLNSLPATEHNSQAFLLELPVKENDDIDIFSLKINDEEQQNQDQDSSKRWSIKLSFDLNGLGKIHAKLILGGEQIQASLWAEEEKTYDLIQNNLDLLRERLTEVEFLDPEVKCYKGKPEIDISSQTDYNELIDIEI